MTGYIALAAIGAVAFGAMVALRLPRACWSLTGAALFLGAAGYAWQGRPGLPAHPVSANATPITFAPEEVALRERLLGRFTADNAYIIASDAMLRDGDTRAATEVILGGIRAIPRSMALWTQLGTDLALHDGDQLSPAALAAFRQAMRLAPRHPGPSYYLGLAYIRAGDIAAARTQWARAVALCAPGSDYRAIIAEQLARLDALVAMARAMEGAAAGQPAAR